MSIKFPFLADSRHDIRFEFADSRQNIRFKFHADNMTHHENPDLKNIAMRIKADSLILLIQILALLDGIAMCINANGDLEVHIGTRPELGEAAMRIMVSELTTNLDVKILKDSHGDINLAIQVGDDTSTEAMIDLTRTALMRAMLKLRSGDDLETHESIVAGTTDPAGMYIHSADGIAIGPVALNIDELNSAMMGICEMWEPVTVGQLDEIMLSLLDPDKIPDYWHTQLNPHLEIAVVKDTGARSYIVLRAVDDTGAQLDEALKLGYLDELQLSEADPIKNIGLRPIPIN